MNKRLFLFITILSILIAANAFSKTIDENSDKFDFVSYKGIYGTDLITNNNTFNLNTNIGISIPDTIIEVYFDFDLIFGMSEYLFMPFSSIGMRLYILKNILNVYTDIGFNYLNLIIGNSFNYSYALGSEIIIPGTDIDFIFGFEYFAQNSQILKGYLPGNQWYDPLKTISFSLGFRLHNTVPIWF